MKKTYIMPLMEVVKTEVEQMLTESIGADIFDESMHTPASKEDLDAIFDGLW